MALKPHLTGATQDRADATRSLPFAPRYSPRLLAARPARVHPVVGRLGPGPARDARHRHGRRLCAARQRVALGGAARRFAKRHDRRLAAVDRLGCLAGAACAEARTLAGGGAGEPVAAGGEPDQERQPHQLPLGSARFRRPGRACVALGTWPGRRRPRAVFSGRSRVQRFCVCGAEPAVAAGACGCFRSSESRRFSLARRSLVHRPAGGCGADRARRALSEPHAVDAVDLQRGVFGRLVAGLTNQAEGAAADTPLCRRRWCPAPRASRKTTPCPRVRRTGARLARW